MTEELLYGGRWLNLKRCGQWEYVERVNPGGAVVMLAIAERKLLLVEQFRAAIGQRTIELPAGLVGDHAHLRGEALVDAARRELEEETGYTCAGIERLHSGPSSAGMSSEIIHFVRATGLRRIGDGGGDDSENIVVHAVLLLEIADWLSRQASQGRSIDPKLMAGLWLLENPGPYNVE